MRDRGREQPGQDAGDGGLAGVAVRSRVDEVHVGAGVVRRDEDEGDDQLLVQPLRLVVAINFPNKRGISILMIMCNRS